MTTFIKTKKKVYSQKLMKILLMLYEKKNEKIIYQCDDDDEKL